MRTRPAPFGLTMSNSQSSQDGMSRPAENRRQAWYGRFRLAQSGYMIDYTSISASQEPLRRAPACPRDGLGLQAPRGGGRDDRSEGRSFFVRTRNPSGAC